MVKTACAECGFYVIPTDELDESARADHDPEIVENTLAGIEREVDPLIAALVDGHFPLSDEERVKISVFTALQITRGWRFREDMNELGNILMREQLPMIPPATIRDWLRDHGEPHNGKAVRAFRERMLNEDTGLRITATQSHAVQQALRSAIEDFGPRLVARPLRLLKFPDNLLLTSDNPVGIWSPAPSGIAPTIGRGTAPMIFLPLDRRTALAFATTGRDKVSNSGPTRARQINQSVIEDARRWIFHHPDDQPLKDIDIPPPMEFAHDIVETWQDDAGMTHELHRVARCAGSWAAATTD